MCLFASFSCTSSSPACHNNLQSVQDRAEGVRSSWGTGKSMSRAAQHNTAAVDSSSVVFPEHSTEAEGLQRAASSHTLPQHTHPLRLPTPPLPTHVATDVGRQQQQPGLVSSFAHHSTAAAAASGAPPTAQALALPSAGSLPLPPTLSFAPTLSQPIPPSQQHALSPLKQIIGLHSAGSGSWAQQFAGSSSPHSSRGTSISFSLPHSDQQHPNQQPEQQQRDPLLHHHHSSSVSRVDSSQQLSAHNAPQSPNQHTGDFSIAAWDEPERDLAVHFTPGVALSVCLLWLSAFLKLRGLAVQCHVRHAWSLKTQNASLSQCREATQTPAWSQAPSFSLAPCKFFCWEPLRC